MTNMAAKAAPSTYTRVDTPPLTIFVRISLHHHSTTTTPLLYRYSRSIRRFFRHGKAPATSDAKTCRLQGDFADNVGKIALRFRSFGLFNMIKLAAVFLIQG